LRFNGVTTVMPDSHGRPRSRGSCAARTCSSSITTAVNFPQSAWAASCCSLCSRPKPCSPSHVMVELGRKIVW
jgi:hypothetical protein